MSNSEIVKPFAEEPEPVSRFFENAVQRLIQDNLDYVLTGARGPINIEALHLIDAKPAIGVRLRYHAAYSLLDTASRVNKLGLVVTGIGPEAPNDEESVPEESLKMYTVRHYFESGQDTGIVRRQDLSADRLVRGFGHVMQFDVEDPGRLDDPLDDDLTRTLKKDVDRVKGSTPLKPQSLVISQFLDI